jgi:hypothetical protein
MLYRTSATEDPAHRGGFERSASSGRERLPESEPGATCMRRCRVPDPTFGATSFENPARSGDSDGVAHVHQSNGDVPMPATNVYCGPPGRYPDVL